MKLQCPHCKTSFQVDENDYAAIAAQVRNAEFEKEIKRRIAELEAQRQAQEQARMLEKDNEVQRLKSIIDSYDSVKEAEAMRAALAKEREIASLRAEKDGELAALRSQAEIREKQHEIDLVNTRNEYADSLNNLKQQLNELKGQLDTEQMMAKNRMLELKENYSVMLKAKDEEIEHYKDMKSRLSTKMLGETLEHHCSNMFNRARSMGQFMTAYFEKDNDASGGTKGDFIFRDYLNGTEYISIMFEMKNEDEGTAKKHRNEDFFAKLDKDRRDKNCEYAILVSTLEGDNELYNEGIVDVSFRFPKMLVVRPQFFMAVISLLSRTARRGAEQMVSLREELEEARAQSIDVTKFEQRRDQFVEQFGKLVTAHLEKQDKALEAIDKAIESAEKQIDNLRKVKALFDTSRQKLIKANEAAETNFTIKKLCHGNPTMRAKFEEARRNNGSTEEDL